MGSDSETRSGGGGGPSKPENGLDETNAEATGTFSPLGFILRLALAPVALGATVVLLRALECDVDWEQSLYLLMILAILGTRLFGISPLLLIVPIGIAVKTSLLNEIKAGNYSNGFSLETVITVFVVTYLISYVMFVPALFFQQKDGK